MKMKSSRNPNPRLVRFVVLRRRVNAQEAMMFVEWP